VKGVVAVSNGDGADSTVATPRCAFPYYGGKTQYADRLVDRMPQHRRYVEAFGGGASVLLAKPRSDIEVFNDADENLVRFFRVLRNRPDELREWLDSCLYSRTEHENWARQFYGSASIPDDVGEVARAGRWFTLRHTQYGSVTKSVSGFSTPYKRNEAQGMRKNIAALEAVRERFSTVVVECDDFLQLIERYDGQDTFWYFDPPYVGNEHEYLGDYEHADLVDALADLEGDWMVSYRSLPDGLENLAECIDEIGGVDRADGVKDAVERVVMSYDPAQQPDLTDNQQATLGGALE